jgi:outer membrane protein, adhesin transport system
MKRLLFPLPLLASLLCAGASPGWAAPDEPAAGAALPYRSLDSLLLQAQTSHPTVLYGQMARDAASMELGSAKLKFLPGLALSHQQGSVAYDGQSSNRQTPSTLTLTQPLFQGGALVAGYEKANARLGGADQGLREARQELSRKLVTAYGEWLRAWNKNQALSDNVALHEKLAGLIARRVEEHVAPKVDADLANARLMLAKADWQAQRAAQNAALSSISQLVGETVQHAQLVGAPVVAPQPPDFEQALQRALQVSPTLERLSFEAEAARFESSEVRAQAFPQLALQLQRQVGSTLGSSMPNYTSASLVVSYAPGNGFVTLRAAEAAQTRAQAVWQQVETARRELTERLTAEFNEYENARLRLTPLQQSVALSGDISQSYDRQYLVGRKSWLDLMNVVREQAQNRIALADLEATLFMTSRRIAIYVDGVQPTTPDAVPTSHLAPPLVPWAPMPQTGNTPNPNSP